MFWIVIHVLVLNLRTLRRNRTSFIFTGMKKGPNQAGVSMIWPLAFEQYGRKPFIVQT